MDEWTSPSWDRELGGLARGLDPVTAATLRGLVLELARVHEDQADRAAARSPYWEPHPASVVECRAAARALRASAEALTMDSTAMNGQLR